MPAKNVEGLRPDLSLEDLGHRLCKERSICTALRCRLQSEQGRNLAGDSDITRHTPPPKNRDVFARLSAQRALTEEMMKVSPFREYLRFGGLARLTEGHYELSSLQ